MTSCTGCLFITWPLHHIQTIWSSQFLYKKKMHVFGEGEEAGEPRENSHRHGEKMQTPHRPGIQLQSSCCEAMCSPLHTSKLLQYVTPSSLIRLCQNNVKIKMETTSHHPHVHPPTARSFYICAKTWCFTSVLLPCVGKSSTGCHAHTHSTSKLIPIVCLSACMCCTHPAYLHIFFTGL